jgi:cysteinyl-tRNA synthetase
LKAIQVELKKPMLPLLPLPSPSKGEGVPRGVMEYTPQGKGGGGSVLKDCRQAIESFQTLFEEAMDDDFNTAQALGYFYDLQRHLNSLLDVSKGRPTEEILTLLKKGLNHLVKMGSIFGLFQENPETYLNEQRKEGLKRLKLSEEEIFKSIDERNAARKEKNWKKADEIRANLLSRGIILEDAPTGTLWKIK